VDGSAVADGTGVVDFGSTLVGVPVSRSVTVRNAGTEDLTLGTIAVPAGYSLIANFGLTTLGPGQDTSFVVQLDAAVAGDAAGTISFDSNDADENPFVFSVTGTVTEGGVAQVWIIDDGEAGFSASSGWSSYGGGGLDGDFHYKVVGDGTGTATWTFSGLAPGQYQVSATWEAYSNRALDAPYRILDGSVELGTVAVDQRQAPGDFFDEEWWQDLGEYALSGDTLVVQLSDLATPAGSLLIADAVRVERVGDLP
jgi:hypothetical protein